MKAQMNPGRSVEPSPSKSGSSVSQSYMCECEGRENSGSSPIREAPDGVRGLTRIQYPSRVKKKGYGGWLRAWAGTKRTVEVKQTPEEEQKYRHSEGLGRETKTER